MIKDSNLFKGHWKLGLVEKAIAGGDGRVRNVIVKYKVLQSGPTYTGARYMSLARAVQNLVLLLPVDEQSQ